jgi:hypothetical protein
MQFCIFPCLLSRYIPLLLLCYVVHCYFTYFNKPNCVGIIAISDGSLIQGDHRRPKRREPKHSESTEPPARSSRGLAITKDALWGQQKIAGMESWTIGSQPLLIFMDVQMRYMRSHETVFNTGIRIFLSKRLSSKSRRTGEDSRKAKP